MRALEKSLGIEMYTFQGAKLALDLPTKFSMISFEPRSEKTGLRGSRPGPTQTGLCSHRRWLEA